MASTNGCGRTPHTPTQAASVERGIARPARSKIASFNILIDNTDDHEKNHALLSADPRRHGRYRLSPAYDVLPSEGAHGYQEFVCGDHGHDATLANAMSRCLDFGLTAPEAAREVARVIEVVNGWRAHFEAAGVRARDIDAVGRHVDGDSLRGQRERFSVADHAAPAPKKRARSPFRPAG